MDRMLKRVVLECITQVADLSAQTSGARFYPVNPVHPVALPSATPPHVRRRGGRKEYCGLKLMNGVHPPLSRMAMAVLRSNRPSLNGSAGGAGAGLEDWFDLVGFGWISRGRLNAKG